MAHGGSLVRELRLPRITVSPTLIAEIIVVFAGSFLAAWAVGQLMVRRSGR